MALVLLVSTGCGSTLYLAVNGNSSRPPAEVFECAKNQIPTLGYTPISSDVDDHRITARRYDWETRVSDTRFRRNIERLSIDVVKAPDGGSKLKVAGHTFGELLTQRGPTEVEEEASAGVRAAAQALLAACGS